MRPRYLSASKAMNRSQATPSPQRALPTLVAWLVTLLQVVGALHFALVPHTFSAALGGVVHVHSEAFARADSGSSVRVAQRTVALVSDAASCSVDSCPLADAPAGSVLPGASLATGWVSFGGVSLLGERATQAAASRRVFLNAPKTSPPV